MKILVATAMYPAPASPASGTFVRTQVEYLRRAGVDVEVLHLQGASRKLMYAAAALDLRRRLARGSIDLVHAHYSFVGLVARTQWRVPVVVSYCGDDLLGTRNERGRLTFFSRAAVVGGRILARLTDAAIVKSKEMANQLGRKNVYIIPHEVDFEVFCPVEKEHARAALGLNPAGKYLLFAANPQIPVKRFPLAKAVAEALRQQSAAIELLVVYKEPQDRLALYMSACDALIFTSYQEGSPNVVKQAMACNLPIVATDVGDVREVIGRTPGCYVCAPDVTEFAARISEVLREGRRTNGREHVRHLSGPLVAQRVIEVYENVLRARAVARVQPDPSTGK